MPVVLEGNMLAQGMRFAIVQGRFNSFIADRLTEGALDVIRRHGGDAEAVVVAKVPGSYELPLVVKRLAQSGRFDAIICLSVVIRGGTPHFDYVAAEVTKGIASVMLETNVPCTFGVLTVDSIEQAIERAGTKMGNKGAEATLAAIEMVSLLKTLES
jgi:6,7-dimethyl-8-ribityllumazine synthase